MKYAFHVFFFYTKLRLKSMPINVVSLQDIDQNYQKDQKYRFRYYVFSRSFTLVSVMRSQD